MVSSAEHPFASLRNAFLTRPPPPPKFFSAGAAGTSRKASTEHVRHVDPFVNEVCWDDVQLKNPFDLGNEQLMDQIYMLLKSFRSSLGQEGIVLLILIF